MTSAPASATYETEQECCKTSPSSAGMRCAATTTSPSSASVAQAWSSSARLVFPSLRVPPLRVPCLFRFIGARGIGSIDSPQRIVHKLFLDFSIGKSGRLRFLSHLYLPLRKIGDMKVRRLLFDKRF